jgi:hypothetical protein
MTQIYDARKATKDLTTVIPRRAEGANPESINHQPGLWIPALASLGRNDG